MRSPIEGISARNHCGVTLLCDVREGEMRVFRCAAACVAEVLPKSGVMNCAGDGALHINPSTRVPLTGPLLAGPLSLSFYLWDFPASTGSPISISSSVRERPRRDLNQFWKESR